MSYRRFPDINRRVLTELLPNRSFISPQTYPRAPLSRVYHLLEIPRSVVDTNDYTYRLQGRSSSRISPIDLSNRSRVVPTPTLPTHPPTLPYPTLDFACLDRYFQDDTGGCGFLGENRSPPPREIGYTKNNPYPFYQGILLYRDILI